MSKHKLVDTAQLPDFVIALLLFVIAFAIRLYCCPSFALSTDESFTANISCAESLAQMFSLMWSEGSPPLFYLLTKISTLLFGDSDQTLKIFALILSSLIPSVVYLSTLGITGIRRYAIVACVLSLFSPSLIRYGNMLRPYALMCILSLLSTWAFFRLFQEKTKLIHYVIYGTLTIFALYSHLYCMVVFLAQIFIATVLFVFKNKDLKEYLNLLKVAGLSLLAFAPWLLVVFGQAGSNLCPWYQSPKLLEYLVVMPLNLMAYTVGPKTAQIGQIGPIPFYVFTVFSCLVFYLSIFLNCKPNEKGHMNFLSWICLFIFPITAIMASVAIPTRERYLLFVSVLVFSLFASLLDKIFAFIRNDFIFALIPVSFFSIFWINQLQVLHQTPEASLGPILTSLAQNGSIKQNDIMLVAYDTFVPEVVRKVKREQILAVPTVEPFKTIDWKIEMSALQDRDKLNSILNKTKTYLDSGKRIWLVSLLPSKSKEALDPYRAQQVKVQSEIINWLNKNATMQGKPNIRHALDGSAQVVLFK